MPLQFGHLFAHGVDRKNAIRNMVVALREVEIRGGLVGGGAPR